MREGSPSNTALWVAALRAAHQAIDVLEARLPGEDASRHQGA